MSDQRLTGTIKNVLPNKGFAFIRVDGRDSDLFLHAHGLRDTCDFHFLERGIRVSFEEVLDQRSGRMRAHDAILLDVPRATEAPPRGYVPVTGRA